MANDIRTTADRWRSLVRLSNRVEVFQLRWFGVSFVSVSRRRNVLVLETIGRRTGRTRRAPVTYLTDDEGRFRIGGGAGGMTRVDWVANLRASSDAIVYVKRRRLAVQAKELDGEERQHAHGEAMRRWPEVAKYEQVSGRLVPYFLLTP